MIPLPSSSVLPVSALAASFDEVTNSYKFYWFLAILEQVRETQTRIIPLDILLARMVASVWHPTNYFRLSFGKQDRLGSIAARLGEQAGLPMDIPRNRVITTALAHLSQLDDVGREILSLANFVPYRFLRPFFASTLRGARDWEVNRRIKTLAENAFHDSQTPCLYRFVNLPQPGIEIHPDWFSYLQQHLTILAGFCLWHLVNYLQKNNPNVPNIAGKLFEPQERDLRRARTFWNIVLDQVAHVTCIYSGQPLQKGDFSLDHFLPWRFVAHDLLWNLLPTSKTVNSSKSDNLPDAGLYFDPFAELQYQAVRVVVRTPQATRLLEDYVLLFKVSAIADLQTMAFSTFRNILYQSIAPQIQIAANMGFATGWRYAS
ncbi:HNH endonuclease domain-containing protein [Caldilinea sp.]|jgi:hypothetical protein|uniref:HNH endonuclease domain-containing protein n=1 Tax=Caldilinea sp. TaxID=2293560 RepID=UPI002616C538|nr:HNH endonuclease domain-containing protein [uncultured Caldilinea sp.]